MKIRIILWLLILACCAGLGFWQKDNLQIFWSEYRSLWLDYEDQDGWPAFRYQAIPDSIAKNDPDAAAIAETFFVHSQGEERIDNCIFAFSKGLLKFPQNDFLLSRLASYLFERKAIDSDIKLKITENLINANHSNSICQYLYAENMLDNNPGDINKVLITIENGNQCPDENSIYEKYKQRIIDLASKAKISRKEILGMQYSGMEPGTYHLENKLLNLENAAFTNGDNDLGFRITDTMYAMQRKQYLSGYLRARDLGMMGPIYFGAWRVPEALELQRANISPERAKLDRLRLCSRFFKDILSGDYENRKTPPQEIRDESNTKYASIATILATYFGRMFISFLLVFLLFGIFLLIERNIIKDKISLIKMIMFIFACVSFFIWANIIYLLYIHKDPFSPASFNISYSEILRPYKISFNSYYNSFYHDQITLLSIILPFSILLLLEISRKSKWWLRIPYSYIVTIVCWALFIKSECNNFAEIFSIQSILPLSVILFIVTVIALLSRWLSKWRIIWLLTESLILGIFAILLAGYFCLEFIVMMLFIIISSAIIFGPSPREKSPTLSFLTLPFKNSRNIRTNCFKISSLFIVVYWILFLYFLPGAIYKIDDEIKNYNIPHRPKIALAEPDELSYQLLLSQFENKKINREEVIRFIGIITPEDLPDILKKVKELPTRDRGYFPPNYDDANRLEEFKKAHEPNRIYDEFLIRAIRSVGKDAVNIMTEALIEPNDQRALIARAELGDITVKKPLEKLLAINIDKSNDAIRAEGYVSPWNAPVSPAEIIPALACVSEPNEAAERYISYIQRRSMPEILNDTDIIRNINLLPSQQAKLVIKSYLKKALEWIPSPKEGFCPEPSLVIGALRNISGFYGDREIAEESFRLMQMVGETGNQFQLLDVSPYFTIESAGLLKKGLDSRDERFRAWSVWQLRKVRYKFTDEEINKLMKDDSWMVRANTVVASPQIAGKAAQNDKNSFVRYVASLYKDKS